MGLCNKPYKFIVQSLLSTSSLQSIWLARSLSDKPFQTLIHYELGRILTMLHQYPGDGNKIVPSSQKTSTVRKSSDEKSMPSSKKITLKSSDGETFEVDEAVALKSTTIKRMIEETSSGNGEVITLPIVSGNILAKVLQYCEKHTAEGKSIADQELRTWDADFVKLDEDTLFQLILAANYLGIERLVDLAREGAWSKVRPERDLDFRRIYGNDHNSDEDQEIEMGYQWVSGSYSG